MACILNVGIIGLIHTNITHTPVIHKYLQTLSQLKLFFETLNNNKKNYSVYVQGRPMIVPDADPLVIYSKY